MKKIVIKLSIVVLFFFLSINGNTKMSYAEMEAYDLDLGEYTKQMTVGTSQLLSVTVLPLNVSTKRVTYQSSNPKVATINTIGRIEAHSKGKTTIMVQVDKIKKTFVLTVKEEVNSNFEVTDLDLGDYQKEMEEGTTQLLGITVLPTNATNQKITYKSSNVEVAEVNELGRITANSIGEVEIRIQAGKVKKIVKIKVKKKETQDNIEVSSIEVEEFNNDMNVGEVQTVTAVVAPSDAINATIKYHSSNPSVATISSTGKITAKKKGSVTITLSANEVKKVLQLKVKVGTSKIVVDKTYVVLNVGNTIKLSSKVFPKKAVQKISYKVLNQQVIHITKEGVITALSSGSSSVIVTNGEVQTVVTVIVNEREEAHDNQEKNISNGKEVNEIGILKKIKGVSGETITLKIEEVQEITSEILYYLYDNKKNLLLVADNYKIHLYGKDIINLKNKLSPKIEPKEENDEISFVVNKGLNLPGKIYLTLTGGTIKEGGYVYLFHKGKQKYELLNTEIQRGQFEIDVAGTYKITKKKITSFYWNYFIMAIVIAGIVVGVIIYIRVAKKYWFW